MKTKEQIKADENFLCGLELPDEKINVYLEYTGGAKVRYYMFWRDNLLFEGSEYRPSPMMEQDSLEAVVDLLSFLCLQRGDVEREYFKEYTPSRIEWRESNTCHEIRRLVIDFNNMSDDQDEILGRDKATEYFTKYFTNE